MSYEQIASTPDKWKQIINNLESKIDELSRQLSNQRSEHSIKWSDEYNKALTQYPKEYWFRIDHAKKDADAKVKYINMQIQNTENEIERNRIELDIAKRELANLDPVMKQQREFNKLIERKNRAATESDYLELEKIFRSMDYKNSAALADECVIKVSELKKAEKKKALELKKAMEDEYRQVWRNKLKNASTEADYRTLAKEILTISEDEFTIINPEIKSIFDSEASFSGRQYNAIFVANYFEEMANKKRLKDLGARLSLAEHEKDRLNQEKQQLEVHSGILNQQLQRLNQGLCPYHGGKLGYLSGRCKHSDCQYSAKDERMISAALEIQIDNTERDMDKIIKKVVNLEMEISQFKADVRLLKDSLGLMVQE